MTEADFGSCALQYRSPASFGLSFSSGYLLQILFAVQRALRVLSCVFKGLSPCFTAGHLPQHVPTTEAMYLCCSGRSGAFQCSAFASRKKVEKLLDQLADPRKQRRHVIRTIIGQERGDRKHSLVLNSQHWTVV